MTKPSSSEEACSSVMQRGYKNSIPEWHSFLPTLAPSGRYSNAFSTLLWETHLHLCYSSFCRTPLPSTHTPQLLSPHHPSLGSSSQTYFCHSPAPFTSTTSPLPSFSLLFLNKNNLKMYLLSSNGTFKKFLLMLDTAFKKPLGYSVILVSFKAPLYVKRRKQYTPEINTVITNAYPQMHTRERLCATPALQTVIWQETDQQHAATSTYSYRDNTMILITACCVCTLQYHFSTRLKKFTSGEKNTHFPLSFPERLTAEFPQGRSLPIICMQEVHGLRTFHDKETEKEIRCNSTFPCNTTCKKCFLDYTRCTWTAEH